MSPRSLLSLVLGSSAFLTLVLGLAVPEARPEPKTTPPKGGDAIELAFVGERHLLRVAVHVEVDGKPLATLWDAALRRLFHHLDRDGDGKLDKAEAARAPSALRLRQLSWGYFFTQQDAPIPWAEFAGNGEAETITFEQFAAYYRRSGVGGLYLAVGQEPANNPLTKALLRHLDRDGDGRVSRQEWEAAERTLSSLDLNEDEVISPEELVPNRPYPAVQGNTLLLPARKDERPNTLRDGFPLLPLPPQPTDVAWAEEIIRRRDRNKDGKLTREEAGLSADAFAALDQDRDGVLDAAKLSAWRTLPADRELLIRVGRRAEDKPALEWRSGDKLLTHALDGELLRMDLDGTSVALGLGKPALQRDFANFRAAARQRFTEADTNGDGVVDAAEAKKTTYTPLRTQFAAADRDGDGKLTVAEWTAWLDLQESLLAGQVVLSMVDQGRGLFEFLDADRDGRLSQRELRTAWKRLNDAGFVEKEAVRLDRLPRQMLAAVGVGSQRLPLTLTRRAGPAWFRAMDRNNDGYVSLKEFVGPLERFKEIDADGDGLISPEEAERAKNVRP